MDRQQQFLWIVQTAILTNQTNLTVGRAEGQYRADISMTGLWGAITEAPRASERIPKDMDVIEAANEYLTFMLPNQKEVEEKASGSRLEVPYWFARP